MTASETSATSQPGRTRAGILANVTYEVMPFKGTEDAVLAHVPTQIGLTVTATERKGIDATVDLTQRLTARGYRVAPHLPARLIASRSQLSDVLARLDASGVDRVFVIGGDAPRPAGEFTDALALLRAIGDLGHRFAHVGIAGYPEGHAAIAGAALEQALAAKAPLATHVITQICFDATVTADWARRVRRPHPGLDVVVGIPAPVSRQKLMRICGGIGLGQSARFLRKQQSLAWRLARPGGYRPDRLVNGFRHELSDQATNISGLHIFTFNEVERAEEWRRSMLARNG
jgi:methylenetetrahydrofolate reductase (NADPH)